MGRVQNFFRRSKGERKQQGAKPSSMSPSRRGSPSPRPAFESLEGRSLMSGAPLPVLLVVADGRDFYYREYGDTRAAIERQGLDVVVAATTTNPTTPHWNTGQAAGTPGTITPDVALADVNAADYSAIAFVGGWGASMYQYAYNDPDLNGTTDNFYSDPHYNADANLNDGQIAPQKVAANNLINAFAAADKPVAAICHGVTVLAWARVDGVSPLAGRRVAVPHLEGTPDQFYNGAWRNGGYFHGQRDQVIANGGVPTASSGAHGNRGTQDDVIVDGSIITAENPASARLFGATIAERVYESLPAGGRVVDGNLVVTGTDGPDTIYLWSGRADNAVYAMVNGELHGEIIVGTGAGGGPHVKVFGAGGNDRIFASDLRVRAEVYAGAGHDQATGGAAADLLDGGDGTDRLWGGLGDDVLLGRAGDDFLHGREGHDALVGGAGDDWLEGLDGRDVLIGGAGADTIRGGDHADLLTAGATTYDEDPAAIGVVLGTWYGAPSTDAGAAALSEPTGTTLRPGTTVFADASADSLVGGAGADWWLRSAADTAYGAAAEDRETLL